MTDPRIAAYLQGDRSAGESLLVELLPRIRNVVRILLGPGAELEDVTQAVLVAVIRALGSFRGDSPLVGWVDRITVRVALQHARKQRKFWSRHSNLEEAQLLFGEPTAQSAAPDVRPQILQLLDALPVSQRAALVLHHAAGLSVQEVAASEGTSLETIRSRLRLASSKLRERLGLSPPRCNTATEKKHMENVQ
jgi:RNA polymerase sigma-70 factor, ECF subfamily